MARVITRAEVLKRLAGEGFMVSRWCKKHGISQSTFYAVINGRGQTGIWRERILTALAIDGVIGDQDLNVRFAPKAPSA